MIPIAFLDSEPTGESFQLLSRSPRDRYRIVSTDVRWEQQALFLRVSTGGLWEHLRAGVAAWNLADTGAAVGGEVRSGIGAGARLFPAREGFLLGCAEGHAVEATESFPPLAFTSATLALVTVSTIRENDRWWQDVLWEIVRETPLRAGAIGAHRSRKAYDGKP
jgi:hypothetical protein